MFKKQGQNGTNKSSEPPGVIKVERGDFLKMCNMCDLSQNSKKKKKARKQKQKWGGGEIWELLILSPHYRGDENDFITGEAGKTTTEALVSLLVPFMFYLTRNAQKASFHLKGLIKMFWGFFFA